MKRYICSDLHLGHKNITNFRKGFKTAEEHNETIFNNLAAISGKRFMIMILGDAFFDKYWLDEFNKLKFGRKVLIVGNHCTESINMRELAFSFDEVHSLQAYKGTWLSHCPIHPMELRGKSLNIYGHCVDSQTEILTPTGWKSYSEVHLGDVVYSYSTSSGELEEDVVKDIIINDYTGNVYHLKTRGLDMRVTDLHRVPYLDSEGNYNVKLAKDVLETEGTITVLKAFNNTKEGVDLTDDMLRLYILLAADGSITKHNLARIRLYKDRKIIKARELLENMGINYTNYPQKWGGVSLNFRLPDELVNINIKGLDPVITRCSHRQAGIIKETYSWTDGNRDLIFTSKRTEVDILQQMFVLNGYSCKAHSRIGHGFSKKESYQLSVTKNPNQVIHNISDKVTKEHVNNELFWCIRNNNTNFIARRNGSVFLTGNCHPYLVLNSEGNPDNRYISVCMEYTENKPITWEHALSLEYHKHCMEVYNQFVADGVIKND